MKMFQKQPRDSLDYDIDLSDWLYEDDRIQDVVVEAPEGITIDRTGYTESRVKVWVEGGESGGSYKITLLVYTDSRIKEVEIMIIVVDM
jgi:hypothetical protein